MTQLEPTPEANAAFQVLLNHALSFAQNGLENQGKFLPFGAALEGRSITTLGVTDGSDEPDLYAIYNIVIQKLREEVAQEQCEAVCICARMTGPLPGHKEPVSMILTALEHHDGSAMNNYLPFTQHRDGRITYQDGFTEYIEAQFFSAVPTEPDEADG